MKAKFKKLLKQHEFLYHIISSTYHCINLLKNYIFGKIFSLFPIQNNKIVVDSFYGKGYGDNAKYIIEKVLARDKNMTIIWLLDKNNFQKDDLPKQIRGIKYGSLKALYQMATAKIWIDNSRKIFFPPKRKKQFYIQTWHGGIGLKKVEKDAEDKLTQRYVKYAKHDSKMVDVFVSNSSYRTNLFKKSFWYNGKIVEYGCPRNDIFFDKDAKRYVKTKIYQKYKLKSTKKIILYVPTFRNNPDFNYISFDFQKLLDSLNKDHDEKYVLLVKLHSNVKAKIPYISDNVIDVSDYPDVDELMLISDIVISDYSSVFFDFLYTNNPVYLYAPDYDLYMKERGLNFIYKELPFSISYDSDELINNIVQKEYIKYQKQLEKFLDEMKIVDDGHASERVADLIERIINGGDKNAKKI